MTYRRKKYRRRRFSGESPRKKQSSEDKILSRFFIIGFVALLLCFFVPALFYTVVNDLLLVVVYLIKIFFKTFLTFIFAGVISGLFIAWLLLKRHDSTTRQLIIKEDEPVSNKSKFDKENLYVVLRTVFLFISPLFILFLLKYPKVIDATVNFIILLVLIWLTFNVAKTIFYVVTNITYLSAKVTHKSSKTSKRANVYGNIEKAQEEAQKEINSLQDLWLATSENYTKQHTTIDAQALKVETLHKRLIFKPTIYDKTVDMGSFMLTKDGALPVPDKSINKKITVVKCKCGATNGKVYNKKMKYYFCPVCGKND